MTNIQDYLSNNKEHLEALLDPVKQKRREVLDTHSLFDDIIEEQYNVRCREIVAQEICKALACSYEDVLIELEANEYFRTF